MSNATTEIEHLNTLLAEQRFVITELVDGIRELYSLNGEEKQVADICNRLIDIYGED